MSKKIISLLLAVMLTVSMVAVAAVSVSAETDESRFVPADPENTHRYYFYLPKEWKNEFYENCRVYWWTGPDSCSAWPGELPQETDVDNIYYVDLAYLGDGDGSNVSQLIGTMALTAAKIQHSQSTAKLARQLIFLVNIMMLTKTLITQMVLTAKQVLTT